MAEEAAAHHLLNVLEERELHVDLDNVLTAFEDEGVKREAAAWVEEYLNEDTLLSKEEWELYQHLKKKGLVHQYENGDEPIRPLLDHELASAIDSLQISTAAIEEQCKVLEAQRDALVALKALDKPNLEAEHLRNERRRKEHQEKARLDVAVEDVTTSINEQLSDTQRDVDAGKSALKIYLTERLASDDKILTALPGIVTKIVAEPDVNEDEQSVEQWCNAIISFRTAEIKARVDAVYLNRLENHSPNDLPDGTEEELQEGKAALQAELQTLHSEIASVAEMVVEHELRKPMMESKQRKDRERSQARSAWLKYVLSTLEYMAKRLDTMTQHSSNIDEFQQALTHMSEAALANRTENRLNIARVSPAQRRATLGGVKSVFPPIKLQPSSKTLDLPPALQDALRYAGLSFNQNSVEDLRDSLANVQLERERKLEEDYASASRSTHDSLAERFGRADGDLRVILNALYSNTSFSTVHLVDPKLEEGLEALERELGVADGELLQAETNELSLSDPKVRAFIGRYGK